MASVFMNGIQFPIGNFLSITNGSAGEDLNLIKTNQIRTYNTPMNNVKNVPINSDSWFTLIVAMQDSTSGTQFIIENLGQCRLFLRTYVGGWWQNWYEIPLSSIKSS